MRIEEDAYRQAMRIQVDIVYASKLGRYASKLGRLHVYSKHPMTNAVIYCCHFESARICLAGRHAAWALLILLCTWAVTMALERLQCKFGAAMQRLQVQESHQGQLQVQSSSTRQS